MNNLFTRLYLPIYYINHMKIILILITRVSLFLINLRGVKY